jgi:prepilin-type processing-associated H-X9-DG protein
LLNRKGERRCSRRARSVSGGNFLYFDGGVGGGCEFGGVDAVDRVLTITC